jgi:hypothetical protein
MEKSADETSLEHNEYLWVLDEKVRIGNLHLRGIPWRFLR